MSDLDKIPTTNPKTLQSSKKSKTNKVPTSPNKTIVGSSKAVTGTIVMGRPTKFSEDIANEITRRVMEGLTLYKLCQLPDMPSRDTLYKWLAKYPNFSDNYTRAATIRRQHKFESLEELVDSEEDVQRARLKVDVIKWQLSKEEPRKYGDKIDVTSDGEKVVPILGVIAAQPKIESGDES